MQQSGLPVGDGSGSGSSDGSSSSGSGRGSGDSSGSATDSSSDGRSARSGNSSSDDAATVQATVAATGAVTAAVAAAAEVSDLFALETPHGMHLQGPGPANRIVHWHVYMLITKAQKSCCQKRRSSISGSRRTPQKPLQHVILTRAGNMRACNMKDLNWRCGSVEKSRVCHF